MARAGVTREQIFETAEALVREGQSPTAVAVRTRLGGGSPNTIAPLLSEWRALNESRQAAGARAGRGGAAPGVGGGLEGGAGPA